MRWKESKEERTQAYIKRQTPITEETESERSRIQGTHIENEKKEKQNRKTPANCLGMRKYKMTYETLKVVLYKETKGMRKEEEEEKEEKGEKRLYMNENQNRT